VGRERREGWVDRVKDGTEGAGVNVEGSVDGGLVRFIQFFKNIMLVIG